ncbi:MAG: acyl-CoA thioesterase [Acidimicrobiia bacterium]|nr:acyl-CoA thioesterase [Acidimicrobiia bacterium]
MEARRPGQSLTTMTLMMGVEHANTAGFVHGGWIMKLVDEAAGVTGMRHCNDRVVTAQVDNLSFEAPVHIGDLVTLTAIVTQAWRTSMEVEVEVRRENPRTGEGGMTTRAFLTMVCVDEAGRPRPVPQLLVETEIERRRQQGAEARRQARVALREV